MSEAVLTHRMEKAIPPVVSIGMPVYNGEKYIREALDSLLAQSFMDFELIISDNASLDATGDICQEYAARDLRIRYVRQPENRGILANFQFVLDEARGEYFMWAAADDAWDASWIGEVLSTIKKTGVMSAFGKIQCINEDSEKFDHYANNSSFSYCGAPLFRRLKYFLAYEGAGKANPMYGIWDISVLRAVKLGSYKLDYFILFDLLNMAEVAECRSATIYKRIHFKNEGGGVTESTKRGVVETLGLILAHLVHPFPAGLVSEYLRYSGNRKAIFIAALPVKYLVAYWFFISSSRFSFRKSA
jgi:glycosyltransferase involved in cell wall biosynthesis